MDVQEDKTTVFRDGKMITKTCVICGSAFETNYQHKKTCSPDCSKDRYKNIKREYLLTHREEYRERGRAYYTKHREKCLKQNRKYREKNKKRLRAVQRFRHVERRHKMLCETVQNTEWMSEDVQKRYMGV